MHAMVSIGCSVIVFKSAPFSQTLHHNILCVLGFPISIEPMIWVG